jgi:hypothetical protein
MNRQNYRDGYTDRRVEREPKVSFLALVFFLIGALPLYSYFQGPRDRGNAATTSFPLDPLWKFAVMGVVVAGTIELVGFFEHYGLTRSVGM